MSQITNTLLVAAIAAFLSGDISGMELVHEKFAPGIERVATSLVAEQDVEDVVHDTLLSAFEAPGAIRENWGRDPKSFGRWIRQVARNQANALHRSRKPRKSDVPYPEEETPSQSDPPPRFELEDDSTNALEQVSQVDKEAAWLLELRFLLDLSRPEIADLLDVREKTVTNRVSKAKELAASLCGAI